MWNNFWTKHTIQVILTSYNLFSSLRNPFVNNFPHLLFLSGNHHKIILLNSLYKFNMINYVSASVSQEIQECNDLEALRDLRFEEYEGLPDVNDIVVNPKISIKIMNYNVLSQRLLEQHSYLYRECSPITLKWNFRFPRILRQIIEQNPDILCLQEVQENQISDFYYKLEDLGYDSIFIKRTGLDKGDGCAIYFRRNMFDLIKESKVPFFRHSIPRLDRDNVGLVIKLRLKAAQEKQIIVATTHLLYNPRRVDVRLAQMRLLLSEVHRLADENSIIFLTGDLNSQPDSLLVKFISEGSVLDYFQPALPPGVADLPPCHESSLGSDEDKCPTKECRNWQQLSPRTQEIDSDTESKAHLEKYLKVKSSNQENSDCSGASAPIGQNWRDRSEDLIKPAYQENWRDRKPNDVKPAYQANWRDRKPNDVKQAYQENWSDKSESSKESFRVCHGFNFKSAYPHVVSNDTEATTFQNNWITVDYIFYSNCKGLSLQSRLRLPTAEECSKSIKMLPNYASPSDHLPLVATFTLNIRAP